MIKKIFLILILIPLCLAPIGGTLFLAGVRVHPEVLGKARPLQQIRLSNGSELLGQVLNDTGSRLEVKMTDGGGVMFLSREEYLDYQDSNAEIAGGKGFEAWLKNFKQSFITWNPKDNWFAKKWREFAPKKSQAPSIVSPPVSTSPKTISPAPKQAAKAETPAWKKRLEDTSSFRSQADSSYTASSFEIKDSFVEKSPMEKRREYIENMSYTELTQNVPNGALILAAAKAQYSAAKENGETSKSFDDWAKDKYG